MGWSVGAARAISPSGLGAESPAEVDEEEEASLFAHKAMPQRKSAKSAGRSMFIGVMRGFLRP